MAASKFGSHFGIPPGPYTTSSRLGSDMAGIGVGSSIGLGVPQPYPVFPQEFLQYQSYTYWSSIDIPHNVSDVRRLSLFSTSRGNPSGVGHGGRVPKLSDTNMREIGRLGSEFLCLKMSWMLIPTPEPDSDIEKLAQAQAPEADIPTETARILNFGVLQWDFAQISIDIGPLWLLSTDQRQHLPYNATFAILLVFPDNFAPLLGRHTLRVAMQGLSSKNNY